MDSSASRAFIPIERAALSNSYVPLVDRDPSCCVPWLINAHLTEGNKQVHALGCHVFNNLVVTGRGHLFLREQHLDTRDVLPKYWMDLTKNGVVDLAAEWKRDEIYIDDPCLVFIGHGGSVYGHVLLEMFLRLQLAYSLGLRRLKVLLYDHLAPWAVAILRNHFAIPEQNFITYRRDHEKVRLATAIVPTMLHVSDDYHPAASDIQAQMRAEQPSSTGSYPKRIVISRQKHSNKNSVQRSLVNADELWQSAVDTHGFEIVYPETMDFRAQIEMFANAEIVLGEYGSAMHNALFSPVGSSILSVGTLSLHQSALGALKRHRQAFFTAVDQRDQLKQEARMDLFRPWLDRVVAAL